LRLPRLDDALLGDIPIVNDRAVVDLCCALLDAGVLTADLQRRDSKALHETAATALSRWLAARVGSMRRLDLAVHMTLVEAKDERGTSIVQVEGYSDGMSVIDCSGGLERLRRVDARLPASVLRGLEKMAWKVLPVVTCADQVGIARWVLWGGCESPEEHADEMRFQAEEREEYLKSAVTRAEIAERAPEWITRAEDLLTLGQMAALAARSRDPYCSKIVKALRDLERFPAVQGVTHDEARNDGGEFVGYGAVLTCGEDWTCMLVDHMVDYAMEGGVSYEMAYGQGFGLSSADDLMADLEGTAEWLSGCRALDHLIDLLASEQ
jgi:PRTRC genetic system protein F